MTLPPVATRARALQQPQPEPCGAEAPLRSSWLPLEESKFTRSFWAPTGRDNARQVGDRVTDRVNHRGVPAAHLVVVGGGAAAAEAVAAGDPCIRHGRGHRAPRHAEQHEEPGRTAAAHEPSELFDRSIRVASAAVPLAEQLIAQSDANVSSPSLDAAADRGHAAADLAQRHPPRDQPVLQ